MNKKVHFKLKRDSFYYIMLFFFLGISAVCLPSNVNATVNNVSPLEMLVKQTTITINMKNVSLDNILNEMQKQSSINFLIGEDAIELAKGNFSIKANNQSVEDCLNIVLSKTGLNYEIKNNTVNISKAAPVKVTANSQQAEILKASGTVLDEKDKPIIGATVIVLETSDGVITDDKGQFVIEFKKGRTLEFSFIGYENKIIKYTTDMSDLIIKLKPEDLKANDVVVTGFFNKSKESFTGSVKTVTSEELLAVSSTSVVNAISFLTPGLNITVNNEMGSNPNSIPELVLRGTSSLSTDADISPNQPLIILDGVEISMTDLYDLDINEIERINVLKDASATSLYGEDASNGVIVIERKEIAQGPITVSYSFNGTVSTPDISTYDYLNAAEKLDFELLAGVYDLTTVNGFNSYNEKKLLISQGLDTDWMRQAIRTGYTVNNSINLSGRSGNIQYRINGNINSTTGVMKEDSRVSKGLGVFLMYRMANKFQVSLQSSYSHLSVENTPYGTFSDYAKLNPYDSPYDSITGEVAETLSWDVANPLYEATCGNFDNSVSSSLSNTLNIRWDIKPGFYLTAQGTIKSSNGDAQVFTSPYSTTESAYAVSERGTLKNTYTKGTYYNGRFVLNYNTEVGDNNVLTMHVGGDISSTESLTNSFTTKGFMNDNLYYSYFATDYSEYTGADGSNTLYTSMGAYGSATFTMQNKYFVDASFRRSGSSQFGANNRYAPFWSAGAGWNLHREEFLENSIFSTLRLRYSYGVTGNVSFSPYQAITTYEYSSDYYYLEGIGAVPITMGNDDLLWETTRQNNIGLNATFLDNRIDMTLDYYRNTTDDMLVDLSIPASIGVTSVKENLGKMRNTGYEFDISAVLYKSKDWGVRLIVNGAHNKNTILAISSGLEKYNDENNDLTITPSILYSEGESSTALYAVRSMGINPATGNEIFVKLDGTLTETYDADDKVVLGDYTPSLEGAIMPIITYKNFSLNMTMSYRLGGQIYNSSRANNVENISPYNNVDRRAYEERWINPGDVSYYLDISDASSRTYVHSERYVENDNTLELDRVELAYDFSSAAIKKFGFKRLRVSVGMTDVCRISTVNYERGTTYPFSRGFTFGINPTF